MEKNRFKTAVIGAGPSGYYAVESLLRSDIDVDVDLIEKLPVPYGLVRHGVAPDHPKLKSVTAVFSRIASNEAFRFFGNVEIGKDVSIDELKSLYHAIVFSYGMQHGSLLNIPGESLSGVHTAHDFVAWYNGHPDYSNLSIDLSHDTAVIVGHGNVALDVARILAKPVDELKYTDIADHALQVLAESHIRNIHIMGRRGPAQVQFVSKELREFTNISGCTTLTSADELKLSATSETEIHDNTRSDAKMSYDLLRSFSTNRCNSDSHQKRCVFDFYWTPVSIEGDTRVKKLKRVRNQLTGDAFHQWSQPILGSTESIGCGLIVTSTGYCAAPLPPLESLERTDRIEHENGRVTCDGVAVQGLYVTGWLKRGPQGTIGSNRADSIATVESLLFDLTDRTAEIRTDLDVSELLESRLVKFVSQQEWLRIDALETSCGKALERPRVKLTSRSDQLSAAFDQSTRM